MGKQIELPDFKNEPWPDFSDHKTRESVSSALAEVRGKLGAAYPALIAGEEVYTGKMFWRQNPSNTQEIVGGTHMVNTAHVDEAIEIMRRSKEVKDWMQATHEDRTVYLRRAAKILREERFWFFVALMMIETGKTFDEAALETCEAIDFFEYYALYAPFLADVLQQSMVSPIGERNSGRYIPIGIGVSIQPWNFPLAISAGPTAAGLVMGNPMIYKPAEQSSIVGYHLAQLFYDAGFPKDVFHFLPGRGREIGAYLVNHPYIRVIAFTGSQEVQRSIERAVCRFNTDLIDKLPPEDQHKKRAAALEAGNKGFVLIGPDADPELAVYAAARSAFGNQGQKCSANTRTIVVDRTGGRGGLYQRVVEGLVGQIESMTIGSPEDLDTMIGPLISSEARQKVLEYMARAPNEGTVLASRALDEDLKKRGYFVGPMLVGNLSPDASIAQEEIFGPVLSVFRVRSFEEAIALAQHTKFGLTGGAFTENDVHKQALINAFPSGVLCFNQGITGSFPGRRPFGGFKASGNGTMAGGIDYLKDFAYAMTISENTMRHGADVA